jgi:uncharacterized protein YbbC (DUF1343 family)
MLARQVLGNMFGAARFPLLLRWLSLLAPVFSLFGCSGNQPPPPAPVVVTAAPEPKPAEVPFPVMLGIDVLESQGFAAVKGKRVGLLTHPAAVNRRGESTVDVLRRAPGVQLVALYAVEHGIYNDMPAEKPFPDMTDQRTGLPVFSLYNGKTKNFRPTSQQLKMIDLLVVDLQDIGTRSYTFSGAMKTAMEACFENGKEIVVLDRPNPLGGLKVGGPPLDADLMTDVGKFRVPYVHGLTMGELARMVLAFRPPGGLNVSEEVRARGKATIVPMRGWTRSMRWPETGLSFVPTSTRIQDFAAVMGYPMTGLGCIAGGFSHGIGTQYPFRGLHYRDMKSTRLERELNALDLPGLKFRRVTGMPQKNGQPGSGIYIEITDYDAWEPTDLNFWLMKLAAQYDRKNPFTLLANTPKEREFLIHVGSRAFYNDLVANGERIDIEAWLKKWRDQARIYQELSKRYWLYQ